MGKRAFLFPGQGSQEIGMARDLFKSDPHFQSLIKYGSDLVHYDLEHLCLHGPERTIILARYLQPLLAAVSLGYLNHLYAAGLHADYVLGHSLGEIIALGAGGVVSFEETVAIAAKRGELMDEAASKCNGGMLAVMFVPQETVDQMLSEINRPEGIVVANDNAPSQVVLTGDVDTLQRFATMVSERRLGRCQRINVSGPWHSPFLTEARAEFEKWAENVAFHRPHTPIILNATAKEEMHPDTIKHLVTWQLTNPVYWRETMLRLIDLGVDTLLEVGPGRVLSGLARVNGFKRGSQVYNVNNLRGVEAAIATLAGATGQVSAA